MARGKGPAWKLANIEKTVETAVLDHDFNDAFVFKPLPAHSAAAPMFDSHVVDAIAKAFAHLPDAARPHSDPIMDDIAPDSDAGAKGTRGGGGGGSDGGDGSGGGRGKPIKTAPVEPTPEPAPTPTEPTPAPAPTLPAADYTSGLDTPDGFNIDLVFSGTWTDAMKAQAYAAAENISDIVTGDLPSYNGIDDIRITLTSTAIDGAGGTWGRAGTDILRTTSKLAATGHVTIDEADVPNAIKLGLMDDLIEHEILHSPQCKRPLQDLQRPFSFRRDRSGAAARGNRVSAREDHIDSAVCNAHAELRLADVLALGHLGINRRKKAVPCVGTF
jgi:hypothetical protein